MQPLKIKRIQQRHQGATETWKRAPQLAATDETCQALKKEVRLELRHL